MQHLQDGPRNTPPPAPSSNASAHFARAEPDESAVGPVRPDPMRHSSGSSPQAAPSSALQHTLTEPTGLACARTARPAREMYISALVRALLYISPPLIIRLRGRQRRRPR